MKENYFEIWIKGLKIDENYELVIFVIIVMGFVTDMCIGSEVKM